MKKFITALLVVALLTVSGSACFAASKKKAAKKAAEQTQPKEVAQQTENKVVVTDTQTASTTENPAMKAIEEITGQTQTATKTGSTATKQAQLVEAPKQQAKAVSVPEQKTEIIATFSLADHPGETETTESLLVSAEWLKANLDKVILVDCRFASLYASSHIPGAVNATWTYFVNTSAPNGTDKYGTILPTAQLAKKIGALGINGSRPVVCYSDSGDWGQGAWTVALIRMAGIKNAKMLHGGIYGWKNAKYPVTDKPKRNAAVPFSIKKLDSCYVIETEKMKAALGQPNIVIVDVRTPQEYNGKIAPFKEKRKGHIPGAINLPTDEFVTHTGHFKPINEIQALLEANGITKDKIVVLYDTCGVRAGFVTMVCRLAGYPHACFYDNGYQAWAGDPMLPLE